MAKRCIRIFDTTLRDGEQAPGVNLNTQEKLELAWGLESLGVDILEAGFPASSVGDFDAVRTIATELRHSGVAALCRARIPDVQRAWDALKYSAFPVIHVFIATSPLHMQYKLRMNEAQVTEAAVAAVRYARNLCGEVEFSTEDGSRSDPAFLYRLIQQVIAAGATVINVPDTVGYSVPEEYAALLRGIRENVPNIDAAILSAHCHDDLGLAVANSLAAIQAGVGQVECTVNGIGERAGNAALEELAMVLRTRSEVYNATTNIDTRQIYRVSHLVSSLTGMDINRGKAIVGANAFRHESGIHQHGMLAHRGTYEIMTPESIGIPQSAMVLGKHSGRHAFAERLQQLGYKLSDPRVDEAFSQFKDLADRKKDISDADLIAIVGQKVYEAPPVYNLEAFQIHSGNRIGGLAKVSLSTTDGSILTEAGFGEGPVDAIYRTIDRMVELPITLCAYKIKAVTEGQDALGEVSVSITLGDDPAQYPGKGLSSDILEASTLAYISAINRALTEQALYTTSADE